MESKLHMIFRSSVAIFVTLVLVTQCGTWAYGAERMLAPRTLMPTRPSTTRSITQNQQTATTFHSESYVRREKLKITLGEIIGKINTSLRTIWLWIKETIRAQGKTEVQRYLDNLNRTQDTEARLGTKKTIRLQGKTGIQGYFDNLLTKLKRAKNTEARLDIITTEIHSETPPFYANVDCLLEVLRAFDKNHEILISTERKRLLKLYQVFQAIVDHVLETMDANLQYKKISPIGCAATLRACQHCLRKFSENPNFSTITNKKNEPKRAKQMCAVEEKVQLWEFRHSLKLQGITEVQPYLDNLNTKLKHAQNTEARLGTKKTIRLQGKTGIQGYFDNLLTKLKRAKNTEARLDIITTEIHSETPPFYANVDCLLEVLRAFDKNHEILISTERKRLLKLYQVFQAIVDHVLETMDANLQYKKISPIGCAATLRACQHCLRKFSENPNFSTITNKKNEPKRAKQMCAVEEKVQLWEFRHSLKLQGITEVQPYLDNLNTKLKHAQNTEARLGTKKTIRLQGKTEAQRYFDNLLTKLKRAKNTEARLGIITTEIHSETPPFYANVDCLLEVLRAFDKNHEILISTERKRLLKLYQVFQAIVDHVLETMDANLQYKKISPIGCAATLRACQHCLRKFSENPNFSTITNKKNEPKRAKQMCAVEEKVQLWEFRHSLKLQGITEVQPYLDNLNTKLKHAQNTEARLGTKKTIRLQGKTEAQRYFDNLLTKLKRAKNTEARLGIITTEIHSETPPFYANVDCLLEVLRAFDKNHEILISTERKRLLKLYQVFQAIVDHVLETMDANLQYKKISPIGCAATLRACQHCLRKFSENPNFSTITNKKNEPKRAKQMCAVEEKVQLWEFRHSLKNIETWLTQARTRSDALRHKALSGFKYHELAKSVEELSQIKSLIGPLDATLHKLKDEISKQTTARLLSSEIARIEKDMRNFRENSLAALQQACQFGVMEASYATLTAPPTHEFSYQEPGQVEKKLDEVAWLLRSLDTAITACEKITKKHSGQIKNALLKRIQTIKKKVPALRNGFRYAEEVCAVALERGISEYKKQTCEPSLKLRSPGTYLEAQVSQMYGEYNNPMRGKFESFKLYHEGSKLLREKGIRLIPGLPKLEAFHWEDEDNLRSSPMYLDLAHRVYQQEWLIPFMDHCREVLQPFLNKEKPNTKKNYLQCIHDLYRIEALLNNFHFLAWSYDEYLYGKGNTNILEVHQIFKTAMGNVRTWIKNIAIEKLTKLDYEDVESKRKLWWIANNVDIHFRILGDCKFHLKAQVGRAIERFLYQQLVSVLHSDSTITETEGIFTLINKYTSFLEVGDILEKLLNQLLQKSIPNDLDFREYHERVYTRIRLISLFEEKYPNYRHQFLSNRNKEMLQGHINALLNKTSAGLVLHSDFMKKGTEHVLFCFKYYICVYESFPDYFVDGFMDSKWMKLKKLQDKYWQAMAQELLGYFVERLFRIAEQEGLCSRIRDIFSKTSYPIRFLLSLLENNKKAWARFYDDEILVNNIRALVTRLVSVYNSLENRDLNDLKNIQTEVVSLLLDHLPDSHNGPQLVSEIVTSLHINNRRIIKLLGKNKNGICSSIAQNTSNVVAAGLSDHFPLDELFDRSA